MLHRSKLLEDTLRRLVQRSRAQDNHRAALQRIRLLATEDQGLAWHIDSIEEAFPLLSRLNRGQRERNRFVMGIEEKQNGVTDNRVPKPMNRLRVLGSAEAHHTWV